MLSKNCIESAQKMLKFKNRALCDPFIPPNPNINKEYTKSTAPSINHFYEKLLLLKDLMNTKTGRLIAQERHAYMESFLTQFYHEWEELNKHHFLQ